MSASIARLPGRFLTVPVVAAATVALVAGPAAASAGSYTVTVSSGASFQLLTSNNLLPAGQTDDATSTLSTTGFGARRLPFPLKMYIAQSTTATVSSNGNVQLASTGSSDYHNGCLPSSTFTVATAMPYWDDLIFDTTQTHPWQEGIFTRTSGTAPHRSFTISWQGRELASPQPLVLAQVTFKEGSPNPTFVYGSTGGGSATVGVQAKGLIQSTQWTCNGTGTAAGVSSGQRLAFTHHP